ncbi:pyrimidine 5'-nucleotidase [Candidimonas humi]|uniref:Pyrimidine 5'-nucleotidase n=1 Tax=Candidimonas humi TaxID=683355 RepID=A0ABV8P3H4_9BURK|nr:pyrimidine 5'-nucleotidase [Candidimonas humi]
MRTGIAQARRGIVRGGRSAAAGTVWLFDLDNTLHDASRAIFAAIDRSMTEAVMQSLDLDREAATRLRTRYWKRYGATAIGMERHHGVDIDAFLTLSHSFEIAPLVHGETGLARRLARLPGRKIVLTNAPLPYACTVLRTLGILRQFDRVWAINHMRLQGRVRPKPSLALMRQVLAQLRVPAARAVLVEDTLGNLRTARQAGMRTVHVYHPGTPFSGKHSGRSHHVGLRVNSVSELLLGRRPLRR